jgi:ribosomal protein L21E
MNDRLRGEPFDVGDRVRVDIPDETHPDFRHHGQSGEIISVLLDGERHSLSTGSMAREVRVDLDAGGVVDVAAVYVRPPI